MLSAVGVSYKVEIALGFLIVKGVLWTLVAEKLKEIIHIKIQSASKNGDKQTIHKCIFIVCFPYQLYNFKDAPKCRLCCQFLCSRSLRRQSANLFLQSLGLPLGGGAHSLARGGVGVSQFRRGDRQYSLYIRTLGSRWCRFDKNSVQ